MLLYYTKKVVTNGDSYIHRLTKQYLIYFLSSLVSFLILSKAFEHLRRFQFLGFRFLVRGFMKNMDISFGDIFRVIEYNFFFFLVSEAYKSDIHPPFLVYTLDIFFLQVFIRS